MMNPIPINQSMLKYYRRSPAHYLYASQNPQPSTEAQIFGSAYHCLILEPDKFNERYFTLDTSKRPQLDKDFRNTENKKWKDDQLQANAGKAIIDLDQRQKLTAMLEVLNSNTVVSKLFTQASQQIEQTITMEDFKGCPVHCTPDIYNDNVIIDLKTCINASQDQFSRHSATYGYHIQAAFYTDILRQVDGKERTFLFIVQETEAPYQVAVYVASDQLITQGRWDYEKLLKQHIACCEAEQWPGYEPQDGTGVFELYLPAWAIGE